MRQIKGNVTTWLCTAALCVFGSGNVLAQSNMVWVHSPSGIEFVLVTGGCFAMGVEQSGGFDLYGAPKAPRSDETPRHEVCVDDFWMGKYEITQAQWQQMMVPGQSGDVDSAKKPAVRIAWEDAQAFLQKVNGLAAGEGAMLRLPTEAEWEFACQPGEPKGDLDDAYGPRNDALLKTAWYREPRRENPQTRNVGELEANPLGLHDMLGNVWEWTQDVYLSDGYLRHKGRNPSVLTGGERRVLRGGSFKGDITQVRCGARAYGVPNDRLPTVGLRLVRDAKGR